MKTQCVGQHGIGCSCMQNVYPQLKPQHAPDAVLVERYEIVNRYLQNQCALSWEQLVKTIVNTEPGIARAVNCHEELLQLAKDGLSLLILASYPDERKESAVVARFKEVIAKAEGKTDACGWQG